MFAFYFYVVPLFRNMNRAIYYIAIPIFALLFCISGKVHNIALPVDVTHGLSTTATSARSESSVLNILSKEHNHRVKNIIRLKALDDTHAINIQFNWNVAFRNCYFTKTIYKHYERHIFPFYFSKNGLRGPPIFEDLS